MSDEPRTRKLPDTNRDARPAEQPIIPARRSKAARLRGRGENPSASEVAREGPVDAIGEVRASVAAAATPGGKFSAEAVERIAAGRPYHVCGRVIALRR